MEKKYFIYLWPCIGWLFISFSSIGLFIWETLDTKSLSILSLILSVIGPIAIEIFLIFVYFQYLKFNENGVSKYFFGKKNREIKWDQIREIKLENNILYISEEALGPVKSRWNKKKYIYVEYSDKIKAILKEHISSNTTINF